MTWRATVLTLYPEMFPGVLGLSLAGKALGEGKWALEPIDIRSFATDKHRSVDDTPAGGGAGMVMRADMAAAAIGHKPTDHIRVVMLAEAALDLAEDVLNPGGAYLAKVLQGGASHDLLQRLRQDFAKVNHVKPKASRAGSSEVYVLGTGFRGGPR